MSLEQVYTRAANAASGYTDAANQLQQVAQMDPRLTVFSFQTQAVYNYTRATRQRAAMISGSAESCMQTVLADRPYISIPATPNHARYISVR